MGQNAAGVFEQCHLCPYPKIMVALPVQKYKNIAGKDLLLHLNGGFNAQLFPTK
jgi:hypothetical protein